MSRQYRAPTADGAVLAEPGFDAIPSLVEANCRLLDRADVVIGGLSLRELRALARREALELAEGAASPPTRRGLRADRGDLPLKGGGQEEALTSPLEGEVAASLWTRRVGGEATQMGQLDPSPGGEEPPPSPRNRGKGEARSI